MYKIQGRHFGPQILWSSWWRWMQSTYSTGSQPPVSIALKVVAHTYPKRDKCIQLPRLIGKYMPKDLIPMQWTFSNNNNITSTWLHTHRILLIFMLPKYYKICIHIAIQIHITIMVKGKALPLRSNKIEAYPIYFPIITHTWIVGEPGTLVNENWIPGLELLERYTNIPTK